MKKTILWLLSIFLLLSPVTALADVKAADLTIKENQ